MKRKNEIMGVKLEIGNYTCERNSKISSPLPDKLKELIALFNVDYTGNAKLINYVKEDVIEGIKWCLEECEDKNWNNEWRKNFIIDRVKERSSRMILQFQIACDCFQVNCWNDEMNS
jgi:hypothetical protein